MKALSFDINTRELVLIGGNTQVTDNPSVQNGMIIRDAKCINVYSPVLGIGFNPINSQISGVVFDLNKWKKQCKQDGAQTADFTTTQNGITNVQVEVQMNIAY